MLQLTSLSGFSKVANLDPVEDDSIQILGYSTPVFNESSTSSITMSTSCPAEATLAVACVGWYGSSERNISSVTWKSSSMTASLTQIKSLFDIGWLSFWTGIGMYHIASPSSGSGNFVINMSGSVADVTGQIIFLKNAATSSPVDGTSSDQTTLATKNVSHTTSNDKSIRISCRYLTGLSVTGFAPGTDVVETADLVNPANGTDAIFVGYNNGMNAGTFSFGSTATRSATYKDLQAIVGYKKYVPPPMP